MATAKKSGEEMVPFMAFKDNNKYKDDIRVVVNGKAYLIKRGVQVMIPKSVYMVLRNSMQQDLATAEMIEQMTDEYRKNAYVLE